MMKRYDMIVVGAGPAGLSAAIEAAKKGMHVVVYDENAKPGGQLFKQIHKFFGSKEHKAKIRGFHIGEELLAEAAELGVEVVLNAIVIGIFPEKEVTVKVEDHVIHVKGDTILIATGASENMVTFPGWTLPGVIGAGAAQTMMNLHGTLPGKRVLMLGSGNVGLVVSFQLMQAGCEVVAVADAAPRVGGYGVHAAKVARCGVPFYLSHTIISADGEDCVTGVTIGEVDKNWQIIPGTEKHFDVDTICLAVGLSPMSKLCDMAGCAMEDNPAKAGFVPTVNEYGETSVPGIYAAGDVSGIEEASSAMIEGRIAGIAAAARLGFISEETCKEEAAKQEAALEGLRQGMFAPGMRGKQITETEEGVEDYKIAESKKEMAKIQIFNPIFGALSNFFLCSYSAVVTNVVNVIRNYLTYKEKITKKLTILFIVFYILFGLAFNTKGWIGIFPILASSSYAIFCLKSNDAQILRYGLVLNQILWFLHDICVKAYPSMVTEVLIAIITIYNIIKESKREDNKLEEANIK